ncbi:hypothetical protein OsccyDRAFT_0714 [Leptolyngbyaceae cyanobacterium JSC-12]|nr:hypothetical protein OsccyDRAFT_0714 [Leptolyngbyaceae cyanobacterium JSC-12]
MTEALWSNGFTFSSPGKLYTYKIIGPVCRLYDREELPYPCCRLSWKGKEPSWNRVGRRFVPDMGTNRSPSYNVQLLGERKFEDGEWKMIELIYTVQYSKLSPGLKEWWYTPSCKLQHYLHELNSTDKILGVAA